MKGNKKRANLVPMAQRLQLRNLQRVGAQLSHEVQGREESPEAEGPALRMAKAFPWVLRRLMRKPVLALP